jgi:hypothetical protein
MQAAGEQQEGENAVEKEIRQIGVTERVAEPAHHMQMQHMIAGDDQKRHGERAEQHADGRRSLIQTWLTQPITAARPNTTAN